MFLYRDLCIRLRAARPESVNPLVASVHPPSHLSKHKQASKQPNKHVVVQCVYVHAYMYICTNTVYTHSM